VAHQIAIVTDSGANLSSAQVADLGLTVLELGVTVGTTVVQGNGAAARVMAALARGEGVATSQPPFERFQQVYAQLAGEGATEIVSIHLSGELSGTVAVARQAAVTAPIPVRVVDVRVVGPALGYAVCAAAVARQVGQGLDAIVRAALDQAAQTRTWFGVDSLEYLRRGGRIGNVAAWAGTALSVKPLLAVREGSIDLVERVRTSGRLHARLAELAGTFAQDGVRLTVAHVAVPDVARIVAELVAEKLNEGMGARAHKVSSVNLSVVLAAHVGPGAVAVVVANPPHGE
jgi:DegV family protein with EDD domain